MADKTSRGINPRDIEDKKNAWRYKKREAFFLISVGLTLL
jgi:hypothetical protein